MLATKAAGPKPDADQPVGHLVSRLADLTSSLPLAVSSGDYQRAPHTGQLLNANGSAITIC